MTITRIIFAIASAAALSACNIVVSDKPMFGEAADASQFRPGIWLGEQDEPCEIDTDAPFEDWPACANAMIIDEDGDFIQIDEETGERERGEVSYSHGSPSLIELLVEENPMDKGTPLESELYLYLAYRPTSRDAAGLVTEFAGWLVSCGPTDKGKFVTEHPFAGLRLEGEVCVAEDLDALRNAAAQSEELEIDISRVRWVREAD
uniref:hypothetical protein n=1 Tax=Parerythrobacter lutipelagi TaxID=1964208 RepID=UPI0010F8D939|nr:hypothetical protein [Parerythrobacter lutipelagi]